MIKRRVVPVSDEQFKAAMGSLASGVTIVTASDEAGAAYGLTATAFTSVSRQPPQCLVCIAKSAEAYPVIVRSGRFAVNLLTEAQSALATRFALTGADKFQGIRWHVSPVTGCPLLADALATIECDVATMHEEADHGLFVGLLRAVDVRDGAPLVYFRGGYGGFSPSDEE